LLFNDVNLLVHDVTSGCVTCWAGQGHSRVTRDDTTECCPKLSENTSCTALLQTDCSCHGSVSDTPTSCELH